MASLYVQRSIGGLRSHLNMLLLILSRIRALPCQEWML